MLQFDDDYLYCDECGCEIRCAEDLGFEGTRLERGFGLAGKMVEAPFYLCRDCQEERDQFWENYPNTREGQLECAFAEWAGEQTT